VLPTEPPLKTVALFAVSRIPKGVEAGNYGYDGTTEVNLKPTSPPPTPSEVHFVGFLAFISQHLPSRLVLSIFIGGR
jgi:hypothetical protein